jgi:hypothetical protein
MSTRVQEFLRAEYSIIFYLASHVTRPLWTLNPNSLCSVEILVRANRFYGRGTRLTSRDSENLVQNKIILLNENGFFMMYSLELLAPSEIQLALLESIALNQRISAYLAPDVYPALTKPSTLNRCLGWEFSRPQTGWARDLGGEVQGSISRTTHF